MHVRFLYNPKTSKRPGNTEHILDFPGMGYNQHWTRSLAWNRDGMKTVHFGRVTHECFYRERPPPGGDSDGRSADPDGSHAEPRTFHSGHT